MHSENEGGRVYHFPQMHDGACFYDILSRFHEESGHFTSAATSRELFGSIPDLRNTVVLPYRAKLVETWLGPSAHITAETIRDKYSSWQYLQLNREFSDKELLPILRADAKPGRRKQAKMRLAIQNHVSWLRYCPKCITEDFLTKGVPYWHQVHQLFGVKYCPLHGIPLLDSNVSLTQKLVHYVPASELLSSYSFEEMVNRATVLSEEEGPFKKTYHELAKSIDWFLKNGIEFTKSDYIENYRRTLGIHPESSVNEGKELTNFLLSTLGKRFLADLFPDGTVDAFLSTIKTLRLEQLPSICHALFRTITGETELYDVR